MKPSLYMDMINGLCNDDDMELARKLGMLQKIRYKVLADKSIGVHSSLKVTSYIRSESKRLLDKKLNLGSLLDFELDTPRGLATL